jgi:O-acetyl-ADP-ribose deacetylase (regulator of RNase III)
MGYVKNYIVMSYTEVNGDLIELAKRGKFDVIGHGCNCFCTMGAGIAPQMAEAFECDEFEMEMTEYEDYDDEGNSYMVQTDNKGNINKLGNIDYQHQYLWFNHPNAKDGYAVPMGHKSQNQENVKDIYVVNIYSQYHYGKNHSDGVSKPLDYEALTLGLRKMNHIFKGKKIGLPMIGAGLAGGVWNRIKSIIQTELKDCDVTVVKWSGPK